MNFRASTETGISGGDMPMRLKSEIVNTMIETI